MISISMVSHHQGQLVQELLTDLALIADQDVFEVILTLNLPEQLPCTNDDFPYPLKIITNPEPLGFAANHNQAFQYAEGDIFCVMNPDIRLPNSPFAGLLNSLQSVQAGLVAPLVMNSAGKIEDSFRHFPTIWGLFLKFLRIDDGRYAIPADKLPFQVDWVAGMFMLFKADTFKRIGGFDAGFFLYYEDVDICVRLWQQGLKVIANPAATVIHNAQRTSRRKLKYLFWHLSSLCRYLGKHFLSLPKTDR